MEKDENDYKLKKANYTSESVSALDQAVKCLKIRKLLIDGYPELSQSTLIDPSRAPKDVICEIFESDYHFKKLYKNYPSIEVKQKTALSTADVLAYCANLSNELKFLSFGKEVMAKRLPKLHRYLKNNLSTYSTQCIISYKPFEPSTSLDTIPSQNLNLCLSCWSMDIAMKNRVILYVLGPTESVPKETFLGTYTLTGELLGKIYQAVEDILKSL